MWTLHNVTQETKTVLKWIAIIIGICVLLYFGYKGVLSLREYFYPTPPAPPTVGFGKLPKLEFPKNVVSGDFSYELDTISGFLPGFPDRQKVYDMQLKTTSLLDLERARGKITALGISLIDEGTSEKPLNPTLYQWSESDEKNRTITMNTLTNGFTLISPFIVDPDILAGPIAFDEIRAKELAEEYFSKAGLLPSALDPEKTVTTLFSIADNGLIPAAKIQTAQIIRVDFYPKNLDELPFVYSFPPKTNITAIVSGPTFEGAIVQANYFYQAVGEKNETYPIKSSATAFEELKDGKAYIASYTGTSPTIKIKDIYLAYYLPTTEQAYLYPIIVFKGTDNFFGYIPAISSEWLE